MRNGRVSLVSRVSRAGRVVLVTSAFAGFWGGAVLLAWLVLPVLALASREPRRACQRLVAWTFRVFHGYMRMLGLLDARIIGELPDLHTPVVLIANHTTLVDVTAILARVPNVCCVAKTVYTSNPFVGRLLSLCGFIDAGATVADRAAMVGRAMRRLEEGYHVLVFPEGARSPEGSMSRFQRGAFEIACRANVPVVPLVLRCRPSALRRDQRFWQQPDGIARLTIEIDDPVHPAEFAQASRRMKVAVEAHYRSRLGLDDGSVPAANSARLHLHRARPD
jgi:1-acyl-sn-glycerol-3-phosphate acyltransferase